MKKSIFLCLYILVLVIKAFSQGSEKPLYDFPIDVSYTVSRTELSVGDSVEINGTIKLIKEHENYERGMNFVIMNQNHNAIHGLIRAGISPESLEKETYSILPNYWKILYSDDDKIINDDNMEVIYSFRLKLVKKPDRKNLTIPIRLSHFEYFNVYGNLKEYVRYNSGRFHFEKEIELICNEPGLENIQKPDFDEIDGGIIWPKKPIKLSDELPQTIELKLPNEIHFRKIEEKDNQEKKENQSSEPEKKDNPDDCPGKKK